MSTNVKCPVRDYLSFTGKFPREADYAGSQYYDQAFIEKDPNQVSVVCNSPGGYDVSWIFGKGVGLIGQGPASFQTSLKNIGVESEFSFNAFLASLIPSTIYTPNATLAYKEAFKLDMKPMLDKAGQHFSNSNTMGGKYNSAPPPPSLGQAVLNYVIKVSGNKEVTQAFPGVGDDETARWMPIAMAELNRGVKEIPGAENNPRILEYHQAVSLKAGNEEVAWCSAFANWVMKQAGIKGSGLASARSWTTWGQQLSTPQYGCIAVFSRGNDPTFGHVGFYVGDAGNGKINVLGGNQSNSVCIQKYGLDRLLCYRWPTGA